MYCGWGTALELCMNQNTAVQSLNPFASGFFSSKFFSLAQHTQATVQTAHSRSVTLRALHALFYTMKRLIVLWHVALFMLLHSRCRGTRWGQLWSWWFSCKLSLSFLDNTQRPIPYIQEPGKPSFIVFPRAWAEYNSWQAGCENTIFA